MPVPAEVSLADQFRFFAESCERDGATTYATICRGVADDETLLQLTGQAPEAQRRPNILLAAVHFLLLHGASDPLADHYDSVWSWRHEPMPAPSHGVVEDFHAFCVNHQSELLDLVSRRRTQTNEVGRCTALLPGLAEIAGAYPDGQPFSLLDLGTSAGLNLLFDRYGYQYRQQHDQATITAGLADSPVQLDCVVRNDLATLPSLATPVVTHRAGLDLSPINPRSDDEALWLLACLWPDQLPRFNRLKGALAVAQSLPDPPVLHRGDLVDDLERVADTLPSDRPLVIFHSWVAAYLTEQRQAELVTAVTDLNRFRPVHYLYAESPIETTGLPTPPSPQPRDVDHATALVHIPPAGAPQRLADLHPHGRWLQWWLT
ncbi:MAG TPA: DUF2332 domain-containing protein [Acidimicrobiales bacterium]